MEPNGVGGDWERATSATTLLVQFCTDKSELQLASTFQKL